MARIFGLACVAALAGALGLVQADNHHNAHALLGNKLNIDGKHVLHTNGEHTAHAHVQGGKVARVEVAHKTKGNVAVTKYKSSKKHHAQAEPGVEHHYVSFETHQETGLAIAYVGWGYTVGGVVVIYWFPVTVVLNGDAGAVVYNP